MKFVLTAVLAFCCITALWGQEVVVFENSRSLLIQSHRQEGEWVYLKVGAGELAVRKSSILKIAKEGVAAPAEATHPSSAQTSDASVAPPPPEPSATAARHGASRESDSERPRDPARVNREKAPADAGPRRFAGPSVPQVAPGIRQDSKYRAPKLQMGGIEGGSIMATRRPRAAQNPAGQTGSQPGG